MWSWTLKYILKLYNLLCFQVQLVEALIHLMHIWPGNTSLDNCSSTSTCTRLCFLLWNDLFLRRATFFSSTTSHFLQSFSILTAVDMQGIYSFPHQCKRKGPLAICYLFTFALLIVQNVSSDSYCYLLISLNEVIWPFMPTRRVFQSFTFFQMREKWAPRVNPFSLKQNV